MAVHVGSWQMKRAFDTCPMPHKSYVSLVLTTVTNEDKLREDRKKVNIYTLYLGWNQTQELMS